MRITREQRAASLVVGTQYRPQRNVTLCGVGYKRRGGERTDEVGVVVGVRKKLSASELAPGDLVPREVGGIVTDVIETGEIVARQRTDKRRPCPPGWSLGHVDISAGTLGAYVRQAGEDFLALTNNHVAAASNSGSVGDPVVQPGVHDGGRLPADRFGELARFAKIHFSPPEEHPPEPPDLPPDPEPPSPPEPPPEPPSEPPSGSKKDGKDSGVSGTIARFWWSLGKSLPNAGARLVGCPRRLTVTDPERVRAREHQQPYPNRVDAALVRPNSQVLVDLEIPWIDATRGFHDLELGDFVHKLGRTTDYTIGMVEAVEVSVSVSYGSAGVAEFAGQLLIVGKDGAFSAPGDSGSGIHTLDGYLGGLLFAGGTSGDGQDVTIANPIGDVAMILGVRA